MELKVEQLLIKIALLVMENDALRVEVDKLQKEKTNEETKDRNA